MDNNSHLLPIPGQTAVSAVDESVAMDNTLTSKKEMISRNRPEDLEWLRDAGLGLFIHWSLDAQLGCVISHSLVGASKDYTDRFYEELPKTLNPKKWDFDHLAGLARLAGFQYAVFTTKHHNGFCLWDTETTDFSIRSTPYGKDLVRQYVDAFRKQGIRVGFYFSPEDFCYLRSRGLTITRTPLEPYSKEVMNGYRALLTAQMTELMQNYGKIDVMFFDGGETMYNEEGESLQQLCMQVAWDLQPGILITRGAIPTPEQQLPGIGVDFAWEGCITLGTAWQYQPTNEQYKTGLHVIRLLTETRAKGGSLLLNVGPDANGELCREQEDILRELALWHFLNQEAVHNTRPWIITNEDSIWLLRSKDGNAVYAVLFDVEGWDRGQRREFLLKSVKASPDTVVEVLGQSSELTEYRPDLDAHTYWEQREDGLHISAMHAQRIYCGVQWRNPLVLKITHPAAAFTPMLVQTAHDRLSQDAGGASLFAEVETLGSFEQANLTFDFREYPGFALSSYETGWQRLSGQAISAPGVYSCRLEGLKSGVTYQYRAVLFNDSSTMRGETYLFVKD
ncbi:MAG: alpha-L-fucosidase [Candidatus Merdivicinus sp.]|jgi:alpha-L-fucosidase